MFNGKKHFNQSKEYKTKRNFYDGETVTSSAFELLFLPRANSTPHGALKRRLYFGCWWLRSLDLEFIPLNKLYRCGSEQRGHIEAIKPPTTSRPRLRHVEDSCCPRISKPKEQATVKNKLFIEGLRKKSLWWLL